MEQTKQELTGQQLNKRKIPILDAFRFISSVLVVLVHYEIIFGQFVIYGAFATTAVSWFFVVSGFILCYTYPSLSSTADYRRFYLHRIIRIYPVYCLAVIVSALFVSAGIASMGEAFFAEVNRPFQISYDLPEQKDTGFLIATGIRHLTFTQSVSSIETLKLLFNGPLWSLVLEVYFYLCFPLLLLLLKPVNSLPRVIAAFVVGYVLQFALIQYFLPQAESYDVMNLNVPVYTNPLIRGIEFVFGMLLYRAFALTGNSSSAGSGSNSAVPTIVTIVLYIAVIFIGENFVPYQYSSFFIAVPFVTLMIYALLNMHWYPGERATRFCTLLGGLSYVLYCFHWPLMEMLQYYNFLPESLPLMFHVVLLMLVLLVICYGIYRMIDSPVRKRLYSLTDRPLVKPQAVSTE